MSGLQIFSLALLVGAFALAIWRDVNVGLVTIPAAYVLASVAHFTVKKLFAGFPVSLVILVIGVMYLFGHADRSGALARVVRGGERLVGTQIWLLPWIGFLLAAAISAMGALPGATVAIVMPITMQSARRRHINPMLMGLTTVFGALAGGFSPISVFGILIRKLAMKEHYHVPSTSLFVAEFILYTVIAIASFFIYRGHKLFQAALVTDATAGVQEASVSTAGPAPVTDYLAVVPGPQFADLSSGPIGPSALESDSAPLSTRATAVASAGEAAPQYMQRGSVESGHGLKRVDAGAAYEWSSLAAIGLFVIGVVAFGLDVGLTAFGLGLLLHVAFRIDDKRVIASLPWGVALILGGILTYVNVLLKVGTFTVIAHGIQNFHSATVSILVLAGFAAFFSSFESSSVTVLVVSIPIVLKVESALPHSTLFLVVLIVAFCSAAISTSPYHVNGALLVANGSGGNASEGQVLFRKLLAWTVAAAVVLPLVTWLIPLVPLLTS